MKIDLDEVLRLPIAERRLAEHEADPDDVVPWEDIKASITKRLQG